MTNRTTKRPKKDEGISLSVRLHSVKLLLFHLCEPDVPLDSNANVSFTLGVNDKALENRHIIIIASVTGVRANAMPMPKQKKQTPLLSLSVRFEFDILGMEQLPQDDGEIRLPGNVIDLLHTQCFATLRGILWEKCRSTSFENVFLPIFDAAELRADKHAQ